MSNSKRPFDNRYIFEKNGSKYHKTNIAAL